MTARGRQVAQSRPGYRGSLPAPGAAAVRRSFLILAAAALCSGRKSATAAAMTTRSAAGACSRTALSISSAVCTSRRSTPGGVARATGPAIEHRPRAAPCRLGGQSESHPAARPVAQEAHRVDRLLRRPGGDQNRAAGQGPGRRSLLRTAADDVLRLGHSPHTDLARGERPEWGPTKPTPRAAEALDILLQRRLLPHRGVHRRRGHDRSAKGQRRSGEESRRRQAERQAGDSTWAVAGATQSTSAQAAAVMCAFLARAGRRRGTPPARPAGPKGLPG